ncbi:MAG TPA: NFACT family protein [Pyrinomonadaceae bacterium]|nr:NFACT family protein [Pyrinomonadaceae bacterium]
MNEQLISEVVEELRPALAGRPWGKVFQLSASSLAVDFRAGGRYLFVSVEPGQPRLYLISRTVRELERASQHPTPFALVLRKALGGATLRALTKDEGERVVRFLFDAPDAVGDVRAATLVAQLTGRTSNLFLLDSHGRILDALRPSRGDGQEVGDAYGPPASKVPPAPARDSEPSSRDDAAARRKPPAIPREGSSSLSEALDSHYRRLEAERADAARAAAVSARIKQESARLRKLRENLSRDLAAHGDAEEHRRAGDLLLANIGTAERRGSVVRLRDFYAEGEPWVELEVEENRTLQDEAARRFARYTKAKRAAREIAARLETVESELAALEGRRAELESAVAARDSAALEALAGGAAGSPESARPARGPRAKASKRGADEPTRGLRRYRSSDGYEIIVGRRAKENDQLTFRVARSYDTWMHAADYPGSHVVVRARGRDEPVPHRTIVEAAQLAAHFSQAAKDSKVAVNYTQRKFVSKPKGAAPGLVYLSSFRTLLVEPREALERA